MKNTKIRVENWNGHKIRFIEKTPGDWWAVASDACGALGLRQVTRALRGLSKDGVTNSKGIPDDLGRNQEINIINEKAIYHLIFKSRKKEALNFQDWVFDMLKQLRQGSGLETFQVFRMLDKEHQKAAMAKLQAGLREPVRVDYIKANAIANKAVSSLFGHGKMVKKGEMTPEMLITRQAVLDDTVALMEAKGRFGLDIPIAQTIYGKHVN